MPASRNYYIAQLIGWSIYIMVSTVDFVLSGSSWSLNVLGGIYLVFALGIVITHVYRIIIIKSGWLRLDILRLIPRISLACVLLAAIFHILYLWIGNFALDWNLEFRYDDPNLLAWLMLFFIWNLIYFAYFFFQRYRTEEIKNLKLEAARNEYELKRLRDQMNPHFIFNAMNTIRALIDEEPSKAKKAVTQLSNVLRSSLQTGKQELISLEKELQIVSDYLEIEKARYEERLHIILDVDRRSLSAEIPPLLLQTLVENCIKHGISKLPKGGEIQLSIARKAAHIEIDLFNSGRYNPDFESAGSLGLENTKDRLQLSYGLEAWLTIENHGQRKVKTHIHLPLMHKKDDSNSDN